MTAPLFRAASSGVAYEAPDYAEIERQQDLVDDGLWPIPGPSGYRPAMVSEDDLNRIKEDMRLHGIDVRPDNVRHALEGEEIRKLLRRLRIRSLRKVSPTRNFEGMVKLTFPEFRLLVDTLLSADSEWVQGKPVDEDDEAPE